MQGLMQDWPLLVHTILDHAAGWHGNQEIVSRSLEGPIHRTTYHDLDRRARMLASASGRELGVRQGDIVASMAWNGYRHLEIWYGLMGLGAIVHTLNPRLFADQLVYIVNHAEDRWIFLDLTFLPVLEPIAARLPRVKGYVVMTDEAHMPQETSLQNVLCYETLLASGDAGFGWPRLDENAACGMCYTSGTTGNPKGVLYSQRSNVLHGMSQCRRDALGIAGRDVVMPVVPMFHANAWSLAFSCPMAGAKMVMPGAKLDGASLYELLDAERVTMSAAVPTVWLMLLQYLEHNPELRLPHLERVAIGGSACPEHLMRVFEERYGVEVMHAWGMTEMSPIGTVGTRSGGLADAPQEEWWRHKVKQGRPYYGVEMKITDDEGNELPRDGKTFGRLKVKGHSVAKSYYKGEGAESFDAQGWFDTGDVATLDEHGFMQITDRAKDVIKSGGEWISSIEIENLAVGCPGVAEAAVIGMPHEKWSERPLLVAVRKAGSTVGKAEILAHLEGRIARWWMPDDVLFVEEIPHTATGKISKLQLRRQLEGYRFPAKTPVASAGR